MKGVSLHMGLIVFIIVMILIGAIIGFASNIITHLGVPLIVIGLLFLLFNKIFRPRRPEFRGIPYVIHPNKESFHDAFLLKTNNGEEVHTCKLDNKCRVVGAFVTFRGTTLTRNKRKIREGEIKRNDEARKSSFVPGMDAVKSKLTKVNGKPYFHYHRTHLIPFRFCLNDGEYSNIMFTGTSRLNAGHIPELGIVPTNEEHSDNVDYIIECVQKSPYYFDDIETGSDAAYRLSLSLDDFERAADSLVYETAESYSHMFKYGVECIYKNEGVIPSHVRVLFIDTTLKRLLFSAVLKNTL